LAIGERMTARLPQTEAFRDWFYFMWQPKAGLVYR